MNTIRQSSNNIRLIDGSLITVADRAFEYCPLNRLSVLDEVADPDTSAEFSGAGLFMPLLVTPGNDNAYNVIDGAKRLRAYREEKTDLIACLILPQRLTLEQQVLLRLTLNKDRPFSAGEKIRWCRWLIHNRPDPDLPSIGARLGINPKEIVPLTQLARLKDERVDQAVCKGLPDLGALENFLALSDNDRERMIDFLADLKPSVQMQREFFQWLPEIASARQICIAELLSDAQAVEIVEHKNLNAPQKLQKLRDYFYRLRYPTVSAAEDRWKKLSHAIRPPGYNVTLVADPYFEKKRTEIRIQAQNGREITEVLSRLGAVDEKTWDNLIDPFRENSQVG